MIAQSIVIGLRVIIPISIVRWPLGGALLSMAADALDVVLVDLIASALGQTSGFGDYYQVMDKSLDIYYMSFEAIVSLRWTNHLARNTSIFLFVYRLVGMVLFEVTGARKLLFLFPNLFENFYLFYIVAQKFFPQYAARTPTQLAAALLILFVPKFGQEWLLHVHEAQPWNWLKLTLLG